MELMRETDAKIENLVKKLQNYEVNQRSAFAKMRFLLQKLMISQQHSEN